jgi:acyl carrier protein
MDAATHATVLRILADHAGTDAPINSAATFESLGIDSLNMYEVALALETDLHLTLVPEEWTVDMRIEQLFDLIDKAERR